MGNIGELNRYLSKRLPEFIKKLVEENEEPEDYDHVLSMFERELCYGNIEIELAFEMGVPRHTLYRFGYTDEDIDEGMEHFINVTYPK
jgi:hypothetical protein